MQDKRELTGELQMVAHIRTAKKKLLEAALNCEKAEDVLWDKIMSRNDISKRKEDNG